MIKKNSKWILFKVTKEEPLLVYLQTCLKGISRSKAKAILSGGGVRVNRNVVTKFDFPLVKGMILEISKSKPKNELRSKYLKIVYEDADIVVIDKAAGLLSMATNGKSLCVKSILDAYFMRSHRKCRAHVVHRLDRDTSGLLVYAKNMKAKEILEHNWQDIVTDRRYVALLSGKLEPERGQVKSWLKENSSYVVTSSAEDNGGKFAVTSYCVVESGKNYSLVELQLQTGRKNQIRVHMQDLHHPVCGDAKYGNGDNPLGRLALHAHKLAFYHPITRELLNFETPIPLSFLTKIRADKQ